MRYIHNIDRRIIYLLLFAFVAIALIVPHVKLPVIPSQQSLGAYAALEAAPTDKIAVIGAEWSAGTAGENSPQTRALLNHLMRRHIRVAILGFDQQGPENVNTIAADLASQYGYLYGRDWVNFGYRPPAAINPILKAFAANVAGGLKLDANGTPLTDTTKLPIMLRFHDINQVGIIVEITPSSTYESWVAFVQGIKGTPMVVAPTSVMAPECYQYLDSGQFAGMLTGLKGAIEYEGLVNKPDAATRQALALSVSHILIVLLIVLGNVGYIIERRKLRAAKASAAL